MNRKTKLYVGILCAGILLVAYFAWKLPFYEYTTDVYETTREQLFTMDHLAAMMPFLVIMLLTAAGIGCCIYIRKRLLKKDPSERKYADVHTQKSRGRVSGQKKSGFMMVRWGIMMVSFVVMVYGGILTGLHFSGVSVPAFFCPVNTQQLTESSCYFLSHLSELLELPLQDIFLFCISTIGFTLVFGRMICGFFCPMGLVQDVMHALRQKSKVEGIFMTEKMYGSLVPIKWVMVFIMLGLVFAGGNFCNFCPAITLSPAFVGMKVSLYVSGFVMVLILIGSYFKRRIWCTICPLGVLLGLFHKLSSFRVKKDCQACTECGACYEACPMGIKMIYTEREKTDVTDMNCIMCGECVKKCPEDQALALTFAGKRFYTASRKQVLSGHEKTGRELDRKLRRLRKNRTGKKENDDRSKSRTKRTAEKGQAGGTFY